VNQEEEEKKNGWEGVGWKGRAKESYEKEEEKDGGTIGVPLCLALLRLGLATGR
jgi:hypothetical protein